MMDTLQLQKPHGPELEYAICFFCQTALPDNPRLRTWRTYLSAVVIFVNSLTSHLSSGACKSFESDSGNPISAIGGDNLCHI